MALGSKGGRARAAALTPERRREIAQQAAAARGGAKKEIPVETLTYQGQVRWGFCVFLALLGHILLAATVVLVVSFPYYAEWGIIPLLAISHRYGSGYWLSNLFWRRLRPDAYQRPPQRGKPAEPDVVVQDAQSDETGEYPNEIPSLPESPQRKRRKRKPAKRRR